MQLAKRRLNNLWKRLDQNPNMSKLYCNFMKEYEDLGHMQLLENNLETCKYIMPHHGVYKADSSTTKLRVVFDGSAPSTNGTSLNDSLLNGGVVQDDLFSILLRFRKHRIAFTADIKKMYRQIWVDPNQCGLQCILWKGNSDDHPRLYKLLTVTYGTKSAPFLATRVLKQLALDEKDNFPLASAKAMRDFYVDDILSGAPDITTAVELQKQLIAMLKTGGMNLHKWCSNEGVLLENVPFEDTEFHFGNCEKDTVKTLGLRWNPKEDSFCFTVTISSKTPTKRAILADIAKLFDPLGLLGPVITRAKIYLQKLWLFKLQWDDELPHQERSNWEKFRNALPKLKQIYIKRHFLTDSMKEIELHGFSDASKDAYGAVIYLRCVTEFSTVKVTLLCSKSRVSPLKVITIPRLELCAAELLSKLMSKTLSSLNLTFNRIHLYTDSTIVLGWIKSSPHQLKVFVSNRISRIQELTKDFTWNHVRTACNPADLVSRGAHPDEIISNSLWWNGPEFLHQMTVHSSGEPASVSDENYLKEFKKVPEVTLTLNINRTFLDSILSITNRFSKLIRILSFCFRFSFNARNKASKIHGPLSLQELKNSSLFLVRSIQELEFSEDVHNLRRGRMPTGKIRNLNPFIDENDILRVGGRLQNCNVGFDVKHPIILPSGSKLTKMIIEYFHVKNLHIGPQNLLYCVRREFWPLNGRNLCRKIVHDCITCFKCKPLTNEQIMGNLPKERVNENFPFNCAGVDFCGPFLIKFRGQRKGNYHKIYVCIFVCMVTKAVHLDIVCDLTSEAFIACLKRFFARRGKSHTLFSDNAKNFVSTNAELKRLNKLISKPDNTLANFLTSECIQWKFLPPRAPNFGGLWEAGVKSFKHHLKRVVGNSKLTYEEFLTITNQIEGILNSRPLTPLSSDIDDLEVLTPGHFLIGRPITAIVEPNLIDNHDNRLNSWQKTSKMVQIIWKKWQNNYLNNLQQRNKWIIKKQNLKVGDMVLIKEDNLPYCKWIMGRIIDVFLGNDNNVRVVNVKTKSGIYKRSISKIAVLPLEK